MAKKSSPAPVLGKLVSFRLGEADYAAFEEKAKASGLSRSEFFRSCVLSNKTQVVAKPVRSPDFARILYILNQTDRTLGGIARSLEGELEHVSASPQMLDLLLRELAMLNARLMEGLRNAGKN